TLLELLVVMTLLAIAAVAAAVWVPGIGDRFAVARSAAQLERELSRLAADAIRTGYDQTASLTNSRTRQTLAFGEKVEDLDPTVTMTWVAAAEAGSDSRRGMIVFFGTGGASGGQLELSRGAHHAVVVVDWLTGKVRADW